METVNNKKNEYRYVTIAVDSYENRSLQGRISHSVLEQVVKFSGWIDFMRIVNQIYNKTEFPKQTVNIRTFGLLQERKLMWKEQGTEGGCQAAERAPRTFTLWLRCRCHASWQGTVQCAETKCSYKFESFLELMKVMDSVLLGRSPEEEAPAPGNSRCVCRLVANQYDGCDVRGELQKASLNWRKELTSIAELIESMSELRNTLDVNPFPEYGTLITAESLSCYRRGGQKATFVIHILYRQHNTWQGILHCKEYKVEKTFRSFMEMLYLMASALELNEKFKINYGSPENVKRGYQMQEHAIKKQVQQVS